MPRNKKNIQNRKKEETTERFLTRRAELLEVCKEKYLKNTPEWYIVMCVEAYLKEEFPDFVYDPPPKEVKGEEAVGVEVDEVIQETPVEAV